MDPQTELDAVKNLCKAAYAGTDGFVECYLANRSSDAEQQVRAKTPCTYWLPVERTEQIGQSIIETNKIIRDCLENTKARAERQSWFGWGLDQAKTVVPGYSEVMLRGNTDRTPFFSGLRGTNLMDQAKELWLLPADELNAKLGSIMHKLEHDNLPLAVEFAEAMLGVSTSQQRLNNAYTIFDVASLPLMMVLAQIIIKRRASRTRMMNVGSV